MTCSECNTGSKDGGRPIISWDEAFALVESDDDLQLIEIEYDQRGPEPREVKFREFTAAQYKEFLRGLIGTLSDSEIESAYLEWGQEGFYDSGGCRYGNLEGGKDGLLAAVAEIPAEDVEDIWMSWNGGYIKTKPLAKGKYLCTMNKYKRDK